MAALPLLFFASSAADRGMPRDAAVAAERRAERKFRASHVLKITKSTVKNSWQSSSSGALGRDEEEEREESRIAPFSYYSETLETGGKLRKNARASSLALVALSSPLSQQKLCVSKSSLQRAQKSTVGEREELEMLGHEMHGEE